MGKGKKRTFKLPNVQQKITDLKETVSKYKVGEQGVSFHSIQKQKPVFAFDYLSLNEKSLCFNEKSLNRNDLLGFITGLKKISTFTYDEMRRNKSLRFHSINLYDPNVNLNVSDFLNIIAPSGRGITEDELPTLYQFDLQYRIEARAVGFLYQGIFYIVWYDRNHIIYPQKK